MKSKHKIIFAGLAIVVALVAMPGCEEDTSIDGLDKWFENNPYVSDPRILADQVVIVAPALHFVSFVGQEVVFTVTGGTPPYTWDVANTSRGTITPSPSGTRTPHPSGSYSAVYTAKILADNSVIAYDQYLRAAFADITGDAPTFQIMSDTILQIADQSGTNDVPAWGIVGGGETVNLRAVGGAQPYGAWISSIISIGDITAVSADGTTATFVYTAANPSAGGDTLVSLVDANGEVATVTLTVEIIE